MQKTFCKTLFTILILALVLPTIVSAQNNAGQNETDQNNADQNETDQNEANVSDLPDQPDASFSNLSRKPRFETIEEILLRNDEILIRAEGNEAREYELDRIYYVYRELASDGGSEGQTRRYSDLVDVVYLKSREENTLYFQPVWIGGSVNLEPGMLLVQGNFDFINMSDSDTSGSPGMSLAAGEGNTRVHLGASSNFTSVEFLSGFSSRGQKSLKDLGFSLYFALGDPPAGSSNPIEASATINLDWYMINLPVFKVKGFAGLMTIINPGESSDMYVTGGTAAILQLDDINPAIPFGLELMPYTHGSSDGWVLKLGLTAFLSL